MATLQHLRNAPILEALLNLHVKQSANFSPDRINLVRDQLVKRLPNVLEIRAIQRVTQFVPGKGPDIRNTDMGIEGYQARSADNTKVAHIMNGSFGFSKLHPYTNWEEVENECRELWSVYSEILKPEFVTQISVRFLNRIALPLPSNGQINFRDYLTAGPETPPELPTVMSGFMKVVRLQDPKTDITLNISQTTESNIDQKNLNVLLDIYAQKTQDFTVQDPEIWSNFHELREMKNLAFFASITEKTKEIFL